MDNAAGSAPHPLKTTCCLSCGVGVGLSASSLVGRQSALGHQHWRRSAPPAPPLAISCLVKLVLLAYFCCRRLQLLDGCYWSWAPVCRGQRVSPGLSEDGLPLFPGCPHPPSDSPATPCCSRGGSILLPPIGTNDSALNWQGGGDPGPFRGRYCAEMYY